jgi:hypothetical protein
MELSIDEFDASDILKLISNVENLILEKDSNLITVSLINITSVEQLVRNGFVPSIIDPENESHPMIERMANLFEAYFIENLSNSEAEFWYEYGYNAILNNKDGEYMYGTIEGWRKFAMETAVSFPLLLYAPNQIYSSKRPKTEMLIFQQATSLKYKNFHIESPYKYIITLSSDNETKGIPVTRYAKGMSKGLYYDIYEEQYCGTFYYYEPESPTLLSYSTSRVYKNKYEAIQNLYKEFNIKEEIPLPYWFKNIKKFYENPEQLPSDMKMTPYEYAIINDPYI